MHMQRIHVVSGEPIIHLEYWDTIRLPELIKVDFLWVSTNYGFLPMFAIKNDDFYHNKEAYKTSLSIIQNRYLDLLIEKGNYNSSMPILIDHIDEIIGT